LAEEAGISTKWVSEEVRAKELFDITTDLVYLAGMDRIIPMDEIRNV
jgi:hypothetical protein